jgi:hypothetical protein
VVATSGVVLKQLADADEQILSMQAAANERNSIEFILSKTIHDNPYHVVIIRKNLTQRLSKILPDIVDELSKTFCNNSTIGKEWTQVSTHHLMLKCITATTNRILVGQALASDQEYLNSLSELAKVISRAGPVISLAPYFLKTILAHFLVPKSGPFKIFLMKLGPLFEERRRAMQKLGDNWTDKPVGIPATLSIRFSNCLTNIRMTLFNGFSKPPHRIRRCMNYVSVFSILLFQRSTHLQSA